MIINFGSSSIFSFLSFSVSTYNCEIILFLRTGLILLAFPNVGFFSNLWAPGKEDQQELKD